VQVREQSEPLPVVVTTDFQDYAMSLLAMFRRPRPIREPQELAQFIDENAAFLTQKGIYEYARARAGHYAKVLFGEPTFIAAVDRSRWKAYPLGLGMVAEIVEGVLRPHGDPAQILKGVSHLVLSVFDSYPVPAALDEGVWRDARGELARRLQLIGMHAVKRAMDVPETYAQEYFDLMPIHEKLRGRDFFTTRNYMRVSLCNIHHELTKRIDAPAVISSLPDAPASMG
jgi:hypothetical protein